MALRAKLLRMVLAAVVLIGANAGCPKNVGNNKPGPDPDTNSGPDAKRGGAKMMYINKPETDSVSWPKLVRTKWKRLEISVPSVNNTLDCELRIDNTGADLNIDLFNSLGTQIQFSPGPAPNKLKKLAVQIEEFGTYFVRVQAAQPKDESDFTVICTWEEKVENVPVEPGKKPSRPKPSKPDQAPAKEETIEEKAEKGTEGRIIQFTREGDKAVLVIDKGSNAGVRTGTEGTVLAGKSGREPLAGGTFRVTKVLDDGKSVAESNVKSIGKNNRAVFFLK
ncbi:MAG: hypothetical protein JNJ46_03385 [Myxococcales bacterium]|nr:hypothetical protein [Myxococcales bacterium]